MRFYQPLIAEDSHTGNGVHVLGMQEMNELRQIVESAAMASQQRMVERDSHAAVAVLDIENHGVAADFAPMLDDPNSVIASGHDSSEIDGPDLKVPLDRNRHFDDRSR